MQPDQVIIYADEASVANVSSAGKVYGLRGQTPQIQQATSVTQRVYAISGISPRGEMIHQVYDHPISSTQVITFLKCCRMKWPQRRINLVWDNASIHFSKKVRRFLWSLGSRSRLHLFRTPPYCPHYNPDEQVWAFLKNEYMTHRWRKGKEELVQLVDEGLTRFSQMPKRIRAAFRHPDVKLMEN